MQNLQGQRYGKLTVLKFARLDTCKRSYWICLCDCGTTTPPVRRDSLTSGGTISCGCRLTEYNKNQATHGLSKTKIYRTWAMMLQRCNNPKCVNYPNYGGRGITVCKEWENFDNFFAYMGYPPESKSIERMDVNKGYFPENCTWATTKEQLNNQRRSIRLIVDGESMTVEDYAAKVGRTKKAVYMSYRRGRLPENVALPSKIRSWR